MTEQSQPSQGRERPNESRPTRRRRRRRGGVGSKILKVLGTLFLVGVTTGVLLMCFAAVYISTVIIPEAKKQDYLGDIDMSLTSTMYYTDANGVEQPYLTLDSDENRVWVSYDEMPEDLVNALIAIEDKRFRQHNGVDWIRTAKGVLNMFTGGSIQGGSTITQQLVKNSTGDNQTTVKRKITEIFRALELEKNHSKKWILEWYMNLIYLGERSYGVGAASYAYFGKDVRELSLAECASLVGITNNPSRYDPYLNKDAEVTNDAANRKRAKLVLWNMFDQNMIDEETYDAACQDVDDLVFVMGSPEGGGVKNVYNWYQDQVITDVVNDLMAEYHWSREVANNKVYYGGLSIYTNVDTRIQGIVDEVFSDPANLPYVSNSGQPMQAGMVILDDKGRVVAVGGGIGEKTKNRGWSRAYNSKRPSGSSIKPLSVYAPALEMGLITPNTIVDDVPYQKMGGNPWPVNAVGYYNGLVTVRRAVMHSANTTAVRVLGDMVTTQASYEFLENKFHITSLVREKWINNKKFSDMDLAPLALGGLTNGVSVYEMAAAYATFPSMGKYVPPKTYARVLDADGKVLLDTTGQTGEYVLKESTAYYMNSMLRDVVTGGTGKDAAFPGMTIAGKTGTTTSQKDLWFIGYTPYYTGAVWVGYDRQEKLPNGHPQNKLWKQGMERVHEGLENKEFPQPSDAQVITASYCLDSGMAPGPLCSQDSRGSRVATGVFMAGDQPTQTCTMHAEVRICTADPILDEETGEVKSYRMAGEFCPEDTVEVKSGLDYVREGAAAMGDARDSGALLSNHDPEAVCQVHYEGWENGSGMEGGFDPNDPATWPVEDPAFDINDPNTWPYIPGQGGQTEPPEPPHPSHGGDEPVVTEPPVFTPPPAVEPGPGDEPFVPVGIPEN